jgi:ABC-2 type transport system permease protein
MLAIIRKELADHFNSVRFLVLFMLVLVAAGFGLYAASQGIRAALDQSGAVTNNGFVFLSLFTSYLSDIPVVTLAIAIIIPLTGIVLGFDAINSERTGGTLSRLLTQPVYRDSVINGKFLAGLVTMSVMIGTAILLIAGYGLRMIGVPPSAEEMIRLFLFGFVTLVYGAFWLGLAMLFSVVFRRSAGSLLVPVVIFVVFFLFWVFLPFGQAIAEAVSPVVPGSDVATQIEQAETQQTILRLSPSFLFQEAYGVILSPRVAGLGILKISDLDFMLPNPLGLGQSLLAIWPHLVSIISLSVICFAASYVVFMRQEIRAT